MHSVPNIARKVGGRTLIMGGKLNIIIKIFSITTTPGDWVHAKTRHQQLSGISYFELSAGAYMVIFTTMWHLVRLSDF